MGALGLATAVALAAVFAFAGLAKLRDLDATRTAIAAFGAPGRLVGPLALAIPVAELAVAALLLPRRRESRAPEGRWRSWQSSPLRSP